MSKRNSLGPLHMRVPRHDGLTLLSGFLDETFQEAQKIGIDMCQFFF